MNIADQLAIHAKQELDHALIISRQLDYLGKMPTVHPQPVRTSEDAKEMRRFDLENEKAWATLLYWGKPPVPTRTCILTIPIGRPAEEARNANSAT
jgi:hypothetical protein